MGMRLLGFIAIAAAIFAFAWWLFQLVFNTVSPIFGGPNLTYWQAAAVCVLGGMVGAWFRSKSS